MSAYYLELRKKKGELRGDRKEKRKTGGNALKGRGPAETLPSAFKNSQKLPVGNGRGIQNKMKNKIDKQFAHAAAMEILELSRSLVGGY